MFLNSCSKSLALLATLGALATFVVAGQSAPSAATPPDPASNLFPDQVIAKGKGVEVKRSQLDDEVSRIKGQLAARGQEVSPAETALLNKQVLQQLIQLQLLKAKATDTDKAAAKTEANKLLSEAKTQLGSDEAFNLRLKAQGLTQAQLLAKWEDGEIAKAVLVRELKLNITNDAIQKFYNDNPAQFEEPEMVRASHILLSTRDPVTGQELSPEQKAAKHKLAEELLKRARAGEDFAKLAKEYSEDPGSKNNGGEYKFPRGQMVKEFEDTAFSLKTNEISDIVTTQFGYHIIKLSQKYPAHKVELAEVSPKIKDYLTQQAIQKQAPAYLDALKKDAGVQILDDSLKPSEADALQPSSASPQGGTQPKPPADK